MDRADAAPDARVGERGAARPAIQDGGEVPYLGERLSFWRAGGAPRRRDHVSRRGHELRVSAAAERGPARGARGLVPAPGADRGRAARWTRPWRARAEATTTASDPRPAHALGELLHERRDELQLAAAARAGRDPRLRGRARGGAPRRAGPLAALLAPAGLALPALARARGAGCAGTGTRCVCGVHSQRKKRTARKSAATAHAATTSAAVPASPPPPTIAAERPSIRCFSGSASATAFSASGRSSAE